MKNKYHKASIALRLHGCPERRLVDAYPVELPGWPEIKASVHRVVRRDQDTDKLIALDCWRVSEVYSGMSMGGHFADTRDEAVALAAALLDHHAESMGRDRILHQIESYKSLPADPEPTESAAFQP
jgi:hypothetical protein